MTKIWLFTKIRPRRSYHRVMTRWARAHDRRKRPTDHAALWPGAVGGRWSASAGIGQVGLDAWRPKRSTHASCEERLHSMPASKMIGSPVGQFTPAYCANIAVRGDPLWKGCALWMPRKS